VVGVVMYGDTSDGSWFFSLLKDEADVADNPRRAYTEVCRHMGLEAPDVDIRFRRTNPFPLAALIANFDEVARRLRKTRHAWMLDD